MLKILLPLVALIIIIGQFRMKNYFKPEEFGGWYDQISPELLYKLNAFRSLWGAPVSISQNVDGVGRHTGTGQHNVDLWGEVRAVDIFPQGMNSIEDMQRAYDIAVRVGFTGIGLYTDTSKPMLHVDVREDEEVGSPDTWSRIDGEYLGINEVFV